MPHAEPVADSGADPGADVCLVLEGTYPYVRGGVATWVHRLLNGLPEIRFAVVHIGPERSARARSYYDRPANVTVREDLFCREAAPVSDDGALRRAARAQRHRLAGAREPSRLLSGIRRMHLEDEGEDGLLDDFAAGDLTEEALLHGPEVFLVVEELYARLAPGCSFIDFFWHFRAMHLPLVRLLAAAPPVAGAYHAVCTGYAGLLAAVWSRRMGVPMLLSEHGIYARERRLELERASWLERTRDRRHTGRSGGPFDSPTAAALRRMWTRFFAVLARAAYGQASVIVSLSEASRQRQLADGADPARTRVIPNGIDLDLFVAPLPAGPKRGGARGPVRVGFVGRLVPIKDVITFLRACFLVSNDMPIDVAIYGPTNEDPAYVRRCRRLVAHLGLERVVEFRGSAPASRIYASLDIVVLTSLSEGQPLVVLEAGAAGLPVVVSDVGACRELVEGGDEADRALGPAGIVTRLAAPEETAAAILRLARDPALREAMGASGRQRVSARYRESGTLAAYLQLYRGSVWPESAGVSNT